MSRTHKNKLTSLGRYYSNERAFLEFPPSCTKFCGSRGSTAEEIVAKLRQADVLVSLWRKLADAIRSIDVTEVTFYRWRSEYGGLKGERVKRLTLPETENLHLRRTISDLTFEALILKEAASANF